MDAALYGTTAAFVPGRGYVNQVFGFGQGFDTFVDERIETSAMIGEFAGWLDRTLPQRFFADLHLAEVHAPYTGPTADSISIRTIGVR